MLSLAGRVGSVGRDGNDGDGREGGGYLVRARSYPLRLQPVRDQAADGLGAAGDVVLPRGPILNVRKGLVGQADCAACRCRSARPRSFSTSPLSYCFF